MNLLDLPIEIFQEILRLLCLTDEVHNVLRLCLVNKIFYDEIIRAVGRNAFPALCKSYRQLFGEKNFVHRPPLSESLRRRLLEEYVMATAGQSTGRLRNVLYGMTKELTNKFGDLELGIEDREALQAVCAFATAIHPLDTICYYLTHEQEAIAEDEIAKGVFSVASFIPYNQVCESMLQEGFSPAYETTYFKSPLEYAIKFSSLSQADFLLRQKKVNREIPSVHLPKALEQAARLETLEFFDLFLKYVPPLQPDHYPNCERCRNRGYKLRYTAAFPLMSTNRADIALRMLEPVKKTLHGFIQKRLCFSAAVHGHIDVLEMCLKDDLEPGFVLVEAMQEDCPMKSVHYLLSRGARLRGAHNRWYHTFELAMFRSRLDIMEALFEHDPELKKDYSRTYRYGSDPLVLQFLLDHGMDFDHPDNRYNVKRLMERSESMGRRETIAWLREHVKFLAEEKDSESGDGAV